MRLAATPTERAPRVLIGCGCWLHREDFTSWFIITGISLSVGTAMAGIGRAAAITAIDAGQLSCGSGGEHRVLWPAGEILVSTAPLPHRAALRVTPTTRRLTR